jgi:hypothetical protein
MEVVLAGGAMIDLATREDVQEHHERLRRYLEKPKGRYYRVSGSGATTAGFSGSGPIAVSFTPQSPPDGFWWLVQWFSCWVGTSIAAGAVANLNAALMVGQCPTGPGAPVARAIVPSLSDVAIPGLAVPSGTNVPDKTVITGQDQLYALLAGSALAASTTYNLLAGVVEVPAEGETLFW